jgi:hypothetical protein
MLDLGMLHLNGDRGLTTPDALDPFIVTKNSQRLGDCFVEAAGAHLDRVFNPAKVNAGNSAGLQGHSSQLSYSLFIRSLRAGVQGLVFPNPYRLFWLVFYSDKIYYQIRNHR